MKKILNNTEYTFNALGKTITFNASLTGIQLQHIELITNVVSNVVIYQFNKPTHGGNLVGLVLNLDFDTTSMNNGDSLQIFIESDVILPQLPFNAATEATLNNLDVNFSDTIFGNTIENGTGNGHAIKNQLVGGIYKQGDQTLQDGDQSELNVDDKGNLKTVIENTVGVVVNEIPSVEVNNLPPIYPSVLPEVSAQDSEALPIADLINEKFIKVGGYDFDNESFRILKFAGDNLQVQDSSVASIIQGSTSNNGGSNPATSISVGGDAGGGVFKTLKIGQAGNNEAISINTSDGVLLTATRTTPGVNTDLITGGTTTSAWYDAQSFNFASLTIRGTVASGLFLLEGTNNISDIAGTPVPIQILNSPSSAVSTTPISITTSHANYIFRIPTRYVRLRISTASTGNVSIFMMLKQYANTDNNVYVNGGTMSTITTVGAVTTVSAVTSANFGLPSAIADIPAAVITSSATTTALTPTFGSSYQVMINVTAASGTNPTYDVVIQESYDGGTVWENVYAFERITTTGQYISPVLNLRGNRVRYVQTVTGTSPSFNRVVTRLQSNQSVYKSNTQMFDRSILPDTLNSTSISCVVRNAEVVSMTVSIGATTSAPSFTLQGTEDGVNWYNLTTPLLAVANSSVNIKVTNIDVRAIRAITSTAGTGTTLNYILLKGF